MSLSRSAGRPLFRRVAGLAVAGLAATLLVPLAGPPAEARSLPACSATGLSVTALHGPRFYTDLGNVPAIRGAYAGYRISDTSGAAREDLWVKLSGFTGGSVSLGSGQAPAQQIATLASGSGASRFWYLNASALSSTAQQHTVEVWSGRPDLTGSAVLCSTTGGFTSVDSTIKAAANKLTSVQVSAGAPKLGSTFTVTVKGTTGQIGAGTTDDPQSFWMSPSARASWPANAFRLVGTSLRFDTNTPYLDTLRVRDLSSPDKAYEAVYTFRAIGFTEASTGVFPVQQIASGTQIKHTDMPATADLPAILPATNDLLLTGSMDPAQLPSDGGTTHVSIGVTGTAGAALDDLTATLPAGVSVVPGSVRWNGAAVDDPVSGLAGQVFQGPWTVTGQDILAFDLEVPDSPGDYAGEVVAHVGEAVIDTTLSLTDTAPVRLAGNVNTAPVATDDTADADAGREVVVHVLDNDTDADGDPLTVSSVDGATHGQVDTDGATVTYTPDEVMTEGWDGVETFTYTVEDGRGGTATGTITVTVSPPPAATATDDSTEAQPGELVRFEPLGNDRGLGLTITAVEGLGASVEEGGTTLVFTAPTEPGTYTMTYTVTDRNGVTSQGTVTVVVPEPDAPEPLPFVVADDEASTTAGEPVSVDVLANDTGDEVELVEVQDPGHGSRTVEGTVVTYTSDADFVGTDHLTYDVVDAHGTEGSATVTVTVGEGPAAVADTETTDWDTDVSLDVLANDPAGSSLAAITSGPEHGTATVVEGAVVYDPDRDFTGEDTFGYRVTGSRTPAEVSVTVGEPELLADDDEAETDRTQARVGIDVLDNDTGIDLVVTGVELPENGTASLDEGVVTYRPTADFTGTDHFDYTVTDVVGATATATVEVTVRNLAPSLADPGTRHALAGHGPVVALVGSDPDDETLAATVGEVRGTEGDWSAGDLVLARVVGDVAQGTARLRVDLDPDFSGRAVIPVVLSDGHGGVAREVLRLVVRPESVTGVRAGVVPNPQARHALRHPSFDHGAPVSRMLSDRVDSEVVWGTSPTDSVTSYDVLLDGERVCRTPEVAGARQRCLLEATTLRNGDRVTVVAVGGEQLGSALSRVPVRASRQGHLLAVVYFPSGEFFLDGAARRTLAALGTQAEAAGYDAVSMAGHTDNRGSARYNLLLSRDRLLEVSAYLLRHTDGLGIRSTSGWGERHPVLANDSDRHRAANRRVEVYAR